MVLAVCTAVIIVGALFADHFLKSKGHPGLRRFTGQVARNYPASFAVEPPVLALKLGEQEMETLRASVEAARVRGVILPEGRPYVNGEMEHGGVVSKVKLRIKGKMTDHVEGRKWSFRVVARKDGGFLGMKRFSLQHPGTRNYLVEWLHHRLMAGEGIMALRYGFIRLLLNGEDLGIYAYEEHFGPELLENNGRVEGPLFRFDPSLFWEHRLNEMRKLRFDEPYAAYQAAAIDAFGTSDLAKDATARARFEAATALIEGFRHGRYTASEVFHVDLLARRHALIDLMGGHHSMDWSDVKFYYDPVAQRAEPVAYEVFGGERIRKLAGSGRYEGRFRTSYDLHDAYFNDEGLFRAYVRHLERVSRPAYLDSAFQVLGPALDSATAIVYREFPWKELDRATLRHNQKIIRRLLDVPKGFHAYRQASTGDTLGLMIVPVEALPMEVHGLVLPDGTVIKPMGSTIVPCRKQGRPGDPMPFRFKLPPGAPVPLDAVLRVRYGVLGASVAKELEVFPQSWLDGFESMPMRMERAADMRSHPFVVVDEKERTVLLRSGRWTLADDLVIPPGYVVRGTAPLDIDLVKGARILTASPIELTGLPEVPVRIGSSDASGAGIVILDARAESIWRHVHLHDLGPVGKRGDASLVLNATKLVLRECILEGAPKRDLLVAVRSYLTLEQVRIEGGRDQISAAYGQTTLRDLECLMAGDDALVLRGGEATLEEVRITDSQGDGIKVDGPARVKGRAIGIVSQGHGLRLSRGAEVELDAVALDAARHAVLLEKTMARHGASRLTLREARLRGGEGDVEDEGGNDRMIKRSSDKTSGIGK